MNRYLFLFNALFIFFVSASASFASVDPNSYHWQGETQFFEGWYFKVSDPDTRKSYLFIVAVLNPDGTSPYSQAFIMVGNNSPGAAGAIFQSFNVEDFKEWVQQENNFAIMDYAPEKELLDAVRNLNNVYVDENISGITLEARQRLTQKGFNNIKNYLNNEPSNRINS